MCLNVMNYYDNAKQSGNEPNFQILWSRGGLLAIPAASELREPEKQRGDFPETTLFDRENKRKSQ